MLSAANVAVAGGHRRIAVLPRALAASTSRLMQYPISSGSAPAAQQIRIDVQGSGAAAQRTLVPRSASAETLLQDARMQDAMHRVLAVVDLAAREQTSDARSAPRIASLSLSLDQEAYRRNVMADLFEMPGASAPTQDAIDGVRAFADSTMASAANGSLSLGPEVSGALLRAWSSAATDVASQQALANAVRVVRHEAAHLVDDAPLNTRSAHDLREVTAEVASIPADTLRRTADLLAVPVSDAALAQAGKLNPYPELMQAGARAVEAAGVDAGSDAAITMLHGSSRDVNDRLVAAIGARHGLSHDRAQSMLDDLLLQAATRSTH